MKQAMANLFVGNLSYEVEDEELRTLFSEHGSVVSARVIRDRETGRSKGFAFVEMKTAAEAQVAIEELNDVEFHGRAIRVSIAEDRSGEREQRDGAARRGGARRGGR